MVRAVIFVTKLLCSRSSVGTVVEDVSFHATVVRSRLYSLDFCSLEGKVKFCTVLRRGFYQQLAGLAWT